MHGVYEVVAFVFFDGQEEDDAWLEEQLRT